MAGPDVLGGCEAFDLASIASGDVFRIFVGHCHPADARELPVVFVLDANGTFALAVDIVRHLQIGGHLPRMLVVGVGYPVPALRDAVGLRARDLTPTRSDALARIIDGEPATGGAATFLEFLTEQVLPWVSGEYQVRRTVLVGHSLAGLFATHVLLERPATFDDYVMVSPSVWWDDHEILRRARGRSIHAEPGTTVVITVGDQETVAGRVAAAAQVPEFARGALISPPRDMVADARALATELATTMDVRFGVLDDEHHVSVIAPGLSRSLRVLFRAPGHERLVPSWPR